MWERLPSFAAFENDCESHCFQSVVSGKQWYSDRVDAPSSIACCGFSVRDGASAVDRHIRTPDVNFFGVGGGHLFQEGSV